MALRSTRSLEGLKSVWIIQLCRCIIRPQRCAELVLVRSQREKRLEQVFNYWFWSVVLHFWLCLNRKTFASPCFVCSFWKLQDTEICFGFLAVCLFWRCQATCKQKPQWQLFVNWKGNCTACPMIYHWRLKRGNIPTTGCHLKREVEALSTKVWRTKTKWQLLGK